VRTYLLDTCAFIRAVTDEGLGAAAKKAILNETNELVMSTLSVVEMGMAIERDRLKKTEGQMMQGLKDLRIQVLPFRMEHARRYLSLPFSRKDHPDPIDRMLIATAVEEQWPIISSDRRFHIKLYKQLGLEVIW
jgi:PIN domain nuclease of toxin-antitoxin system